MKDRVTASVDAKVLEDINQLAKNKNKSVSKITEEALKFYLDKCYMEEKATFIPQEIENQMQAMVDLLENRINNKSNQLISSFAIQQSIIAKVLANSLRISPDVVDVYQSQAEEFIKKNNRVFKLRDLL